MAQPVVSLRAIMAEQKAEAAVPKQEPAAPKPEPAAPKPEPGQDAAAKTRAALEATRRMMEQVRRDAAAERRRKEKLRALFEANGIPFDDREERVDPVDTMYTGMYINGVAQRAHPPAIGGLPPGHFYPGAPAIPAGYPQAPLPFFGDPRPASAPESASGALAGTGPCGCDAGASAPEEDDAPCGCGPCTFVLLREGICLPKHIHNKFARFKHHLCEFCLQGANIEWVGGRVRNMVCASCAARVATGSDMATCKKAGCRRKRSVGKNLEVLNALCKWCHQHS